MVLPDPAVDPIVAGSDCGEGGVPLTSPPCCRVEVAADPANGSCCSSNWRCHGWKLDRNAVRVSVGGGKEAVRGWDLIKSLGSGG